MGAWEISFKVKYDYPMMTMSGKHPGTKISMWCIWNREMVHAPMGHEDAMDDISEYMKKIGRTIEDFKPSRDGYVLTLKCTCDLTPTVWTYTNTNHMVDLYPAVFLDGWGYYRAISFNEEDTRNLFKDLGNIGSVELVSKKLLHLDALPSTVWTESFFTRMTDRQMESVLKAYDYGYYSSPREVTTDSIASSIGISRSTYEEHLRKAENKIMEAVIPYLKLFRAGHQKKEEMISPEIQIVDGTTS